MSSVVDKLTEIAAKARAAAGLLARRVPVAATPSDVVYRSNKLSLLRYRAVVDAGRRHRTPVLFVPSLINRYYILDLMPGRSLVEHLVGQGHDVWMIDWGRPGPEDRDLTLDDHLGGLLHRCVLRAARAADVDQVHLIGYCMGGTFTAIYAALNPERVHTLVSLAAPIDFREAGLLGRWTEPRHLDADLLVDVLGNVPWPLLQASFHMLVPTLVAQKALFLYDKLLDSDFVDHFLSLETWGNDNVSFPGECFRRYIHDLYQRNLLVEGGMTIAGREVELRRVTCPLLNIVAQGDHIVPERSATVLNDLVGSADKHLWRRPGGHIGAVVSRSAGRDLWPQLASWLAERSASTSLASSS
jgi:polyhydroxyalkanoate synthase subunit PhaC